MIIENVHSFDPVPPNSLNGLQSLDRSVSWSSGTGFPDQVSNVRTGDVLGRSSIREKWVKVINGTPKIVPLILRYSGEEVDGFPRRRSTTT